MLSRPFLYAGGALPLCRVTAPACIGAAHRNGLSEWSVKRSFVNAALRTPSDFLKQTLKRSPFNIFSKTAPSTLPEYDVDKDFQYFFFADVMHTWSGLLPSFLAGGGRNAKTDFPADYAQYFKDDAEVTAEFPHPAVKDIVEPWGPPGMQTIVHTRKTSVDFGGSRYMLGCFTPFDDVELGVTTFRARMLPPKLPDLSHVSADWFQQAFDQLPYRMFVVSSVGEVLTANVLVGDPAPFRAAIDSCMKKVKSATDVDASAECWEFGRVAVGSASFRVWVWRPTEDINTFAVAFKQHLATGVAAQPELVTSALG